MSSLPWLLVALLSTAALGLVVRLRAELRRAERQRREFAAHSEREHARVRHQSALEEREHIHRDLHDDIGSQLLEMIYTAPTPEFADRARAALQNLRDVVSRARGEPGNLGDVLADIQTEARQRLQATGADLVWEQEPDLPSPALDAGQALHLHRIVREGISNAIRHAAARRLRIRVRSQASQLLLDLTDDGFGPPVTAGGRGMSNMRDRAAELRGQIDWTPGTEGGTKIILRFPLAEPTA